MTHEEIPAGLQTLRQLTHHARLHFAVEIDHDVAAEDRRKLAPPRDRLDQVDPAKRDLGPQVVADAVTRRWITLGQEVASQPFRQRSRL